MVRNRPKTTLILIERKHHVAVVDFYDEAAEVAFGTSSPMLQTTSKSQFHFSQLKPESEKDIFRRDFLAWHFLFKCRS